MTSQDLHNFALYLFRLEEIKEAAEDYCEYLDAAELEHLKKALERLARHQVEVGA